MLDLTNQLLSSDFSIGGIIMEWHDENWKNIGTQDFCEVPCPAGKDAECADPKSEEHARLLTKAAGCTPHAHVDCSQHDTMKHSACGYYLQSVLHHTHRTVTQ